MRMMQCLNDFDGNCGVLCILCFVLFAFYKDL